MLLLSSLIYAPVRGAVNSDSEFILSPVRTADALSAPSELHLFSDGQQYMGAYDPRLKQPSWMCQSFHKGRPGICFGDEFVKSLDLPYMPDVDDFVDGNRNFATNLLFLTNKQVTQPLYAAFPPDAVAANLSRVRFFVNEVHAELQKQKNSYDLYVMTGPVYRPESLETKNSHAMVRVIGKKVSIPVATHLFVIVKAKIGNIEYASAFIVPHNLQFENIFNYHVEMSQVATLTGLSLHEMNAQNSLCHQTLFLNLCKKEPTMAFKLQTIINHFILISTTRDSIINTATTLKNLLASSYYSKEDAVRAGVAYIFLLNLAKQLNPTASENQLAIIEGKLKNIQDKGLDNLPNAFFEYVNTIPIKKHYVSYVEVAKLNS
jgi:hypothetical protein